jgi:undecaprenyl pyrophosphate phosphatase UppP
VPVVEAVLFAAIEGFAGVLPLSAEGHRMFVRIWLGDAEQLPNLVATAELGAAMAILWVARRRFAQAFGAGMRGLARPALLQDHPGGRDAVAMAVLVLAAALLRFGLGSARGTVNDVPFVAAAGMLLNAAGLAFTVWAPTSEVASSQKQSASATAGVGRPGAGGAALMGIGYGLAWLPGMSPVGAAFVIGCWLGIARWHAAELVLLAGVPLVVFDAIRRLATTREPIEIGLTVMSVLVAALAAGLAAGWWRSLCRKNRGPWLGLWLVPLSLALFAYGWG